MGSLKSGASYPSCFTIHYTWVLSSKGPPTYHASLYIIRGFSQVRGLLPIMLHYTLYVGSLKSGASYLSCFTIHYTWVLSSQGPLTYHGSLYIIRRFPQVRGLLPIMLHYTYARYNYSLFLSSKYHPIKHNSLIRKLLPNNPVCSTLIMSSESHFLNIACIRRRYNIDHKTYLTSGNEEGTEKPWQPTGAKVRDNEQAKKFKHYQLADRYDEERYIRLE